MPGMTSSPWDAFVAAVRLVAFLPVSTGRLLLRPAGGQDDVINGARTNQWLHDLKGQGLGVCSLCGVPGHLVRAH